MSEFSPSAKQTGSENLNFQYRIEAPSPDTSKENPFDVLALYLTHSEEALSSLYSFELQVRTCGANCANFCHEWLGKRVTLTIGTSPPDGEEEYIKENITPLRKVYGVVTSVLSGPVEKYADDADGWYKLVIAPAFSAACFSRNRAVYLSDTAPSMTEDAAEPEVTTKKDKDDVRCQVLKDIVSRWDDTVCEVSANAKKRIPDYLQLVQNDESDYNFFCRLLATWGLGYCWKMDEATEKEYIYVYDVLGGEAADESRGTNAYECMYSRDVLAPSWRINRGFHNLASDEMKVQNYLSSFKGAAGTGGKVKLSLHDETWDQLQSPATPESQYAECHYLNRHFNASSVYGKYEYTFNDAKEKKTLANLTSVMEVLLGDSITWFKKKELDPAKYTLTKRVMKGDRLSLNMQFAGRSPVDVTVKQVTKGVESEVSKTIGSGLLPRPLVPSADMDMDEDAPLLQGVPWDTPKPRTFMAVVTSNVPHNYQGRNFCRVRELNGEEMWVEMGSPNADSNSGILARPRVDNVLFCMDRGDLSIPIVLSAMFRGRSDVDNDTTNAAPAVKLKCMDRHTRKENGTIDENSALTLRSRTHEPERKTDDGATLAVHDRDIKEEDLEFVQRPQSVKKLAEKPKPFSQIQMFSLDNGVRPIPQDDNIRNVYAVDPVIETVLGFASESDLTAGYPLCDMADAMQTANNVPISRPHLQGISMYSAGDMINQSADHQIMNAGGEIVLTAAQAITLRVGKSVIRISEYGIEMSSNAGIVYNAGAHIAYHPEDDAQDADCVTSKTIPLAGGSIMVNNAGVYSRGPYIANTAVNMFAANTILGSAFTLSDFSSKLFAPSVKIIGGAALEKTYTSLRKDAIFGVGEFCKAAQPPVVYTGDLVDGYREEGYDWTTVASGCINEAFNVIGDVIGAVNTYKNLGNLVQPQGSMVKLEPEKMTLSSLAKFDYSSVSTTINSAASGFIATVENSAFLGGDTASKFSMCKTLYTWGSGAIDDIENFIKIFISSGGGKDTYTSEGCDVKANPEPPKGGSSAGSTAGFIFEQLAGAIGVILAFFNPAEIMAQMLFGSRKDKVLGAKNELNLLTSEVTAQSDEAVAAKASAVATYQRAVAAYNEAEANETANRINVVENDVDDNNNVVNSASLAVSVDNAKQALNAVSASVNHTLSQRVDNVIIEMKN